MVDRLMMFGWRTKYAAVERDPPQIEVQVVLPGDADASVQLYAVLGQRTRVFAKVRRPADVQSCGGHAPI